MDHDVDIGTGHGQHVVLDLVRDVRDDLHRVAEEVAAALLGDHPGVHLAGGDVGLCVQRDVEEALVVADVQVHLGTVLGHEDFAVLERVHGARIDVEIRIQLLHGDPQAPCHQKAAKA